MLSSSYLDKSCWGEEILTLTYLVYITPTKALNVNETPNALWHNKNPQLPYLIVFGSTIYLHNKIRKTKFDKKSWKGILVGYESNGYKIWDVYDKKFAVARDVIVDKTNYLKPRLAETGVTDMR